MDFAGLVRWQRSGVDPRAKCMMLRRLVALMLTPTMSLGLFHVSRKVTRFEAPDILRAKSTVSPLNSPS